MKRILCLFTISLIALIFLSHTLSAQEIIEVKGAKGTGEIVGRISYEEASRDALNMAKVEALRRAGVKENLRSYETLYRSEVNYDFSEFFSSDIQTDLQGAVQSYEIMSQERKVDPITNLFVVELTINAKVILYDTEPDLTFSVRVEGIKGVYEEGEELAFSIFSTKDCYLHIFGIADGYTSVLYPNHFDKPRPIRANETMGFPLGYTTYPLFKEGSEPDVTRMVFVFTTEPISYMNYKAVRVEDSDYYEWLTTPEDIFSWIYSLKPNIRNLDYHVFMVR